MRLLSSPSAVALALLAVPALARADGSTPSDPPVFETRPGWVWLVEPTRLAWPYGGDYGIFVASPADTTGTFTVLLSRPLAAVPDPRPRLDAVLFDADGNRVATCGDEYHASGGGVAASGYRVEARGASVRYAGIEQATPEGRRLLAESARAAGREAGLAVLPFPVRDRPYPLDLDQGEGGALRAADHAGRIVLVDCWATWCPGCMATIPYVKALQDKYGDVGFDVVGINFDFSREHAEKSLGKEGLDWPQVFVGARPEVLDLWRDAANVAGIPRLFLVDREGILRWDGTNEVNELEAEVARLVAGP